MDMSHAKFVVGEAVEVFCDHLREEKRVKDWLAGMVVQTDYRMAAVQFETEVFASNGWLIPDRTLWCAHGSRHIRRSEGAR